MCAPLRIARQGVRMEKTSEVDAAGTGTADAAGTRAAKNLLHYMQEYVIIYIRDILIWA